MKCLRIFLLSLVLSNTLFAQTDFEFNFKLESRPAVRLDYGFSISPIVRINKAICSCESEVNGSPVSPLSPFGIPNFNVLYVPQSQPAPLQAQSFEF